MPKHLRAPLKLVGAVALLAITTACTLTPTPQQRAEAQAVHMFDESRLPFGQRIALAQASHKPRLYGLNPYFGR